MTVYSFVYIRCDWCGQAGPEGSNAPGVRDSARAAGWKRRKKGRSIKDICPKCQGVKEPAAARRDTGLLE